MKRIHFTFLYFYQKKGENDTFPLLKSVIKYCYEN